MVILHDINTLDGLIDRVFMYNPEANADLLRRAYAFSNEMHYKQKRKAGDRYIQHPLADRKSVVEGKSGDLGGPRNIKKKKTTSMNWQSTIAHC